MMFRKKIIYRLIIVFLVFSAMTVLPLSYTILMQAEKFVAVYLPVNTDLATLRSEFIQYMIRGMLPFGFYILVLSFFLSIFFLRKMLMSLRQLRRGSLAMKDGDLNIRLDFITGDELGDATAAFNEMASSLRQKTEELKRKDIYVNAMLDPLWVVDENDTLVDINPAFTRLFGYGREEAIGRSIYTFFDEKNARIIRDQIKDRREKGMASTYEIDIVARDGSRLPVLISGAPIYSGERIVGKIGILKDFREQSELRTELTRAKEYAETIMDSIEDQILVIDKDYRIVKANKTAAAMMRGKGPFTGEYCYSAFYGKNSPCWAEGGDCPAQTVFLTGKNCRTTHQHNGAAGEKRYDEIVASPVMDGSGHVLHVIELIRDITGRMRHEEDIFNKNRELVAINSVAGILTKSLRPDEIFAKVLDKVIEMMRMDGGGIFFLDETGKEMQCRYHRGVSDEFLKLMGRIRLGEDLPGQAAAAGRIITTPDLSKDRRIERSMMRHAGIKGYGCIPIKGKEKIIGVFCLFSFMPHTFTVEEENILNSIGEMTGIALENIRLYERMRELYEYQRRRREDEQQQLLSLSTKLGSATEMKDIVHSVLEVIRNTFGADFAWLVSCDTEGNFILRSAVPYEGAQVDEMVYPKGVSSIEGYSVDRKTPTIVSGIGEGEKFFLCPLLGHSYQTAISVPMHIGEKTVGVYSLYYRGARDFREEELHFLRIIGNMLAVSLERADYYVRAITEKELSETILQSVADGIITVDTGGRTISVNRAFEKMSGVPAGEAVGLPICDTLRYSADNVDFRFALAECIDSALAGNRTGREAVLVSPFGSRMSILISSTPINDSGGRVTGVVNVLRDISREKEVDRMKTEIIRSVSHEFRTPLSAIVGMAEMMLEGDVEESSRRKYLSTILGEGMRLSNMVTDLLSIARIESGKESMKLGSVDIGALFEELADSFSGLIKKKNATIRRDTGGVKGFVGDREKMKQLLMNLIDNSLTFSDDGCTIEISARKKDGDVEISVSDNGWGIPDEDLPHLTERFYRGTHGTRVKGTGLGLSLCSEIVRMHGGRMQIRSKTGAGTAVTVILPAREAK